MSNTDMDFFRTSEMIRDYCRNNNMIFIQAWRKDDGLEYHVILQKYRHFHLFLIYYIGYVANDNINSTWVFEPMRNEVRRIITGNFGNREVYHVNNGITLVNDPKYQVIDWHKGFPFSKFQLEY